MLATGVLGTAISAYFQQRNWTYQKRADKIDKDSAAAMTALDGLNRIVDEKFLSTYSLDDAIKNRVEGDKLDRRDQTVRRRRRGVGAAAPEPRLHAGDRGRFPVRPR